MVSATAQHLQKQQTVSAQGFVGPGCLLPLPVAAVCSSRRSELPHSWIAGVFNHLHTTTVQLKCPVQGTVIKCLSFCSCSSKCSLGKKLFVMSRKAVVPDPAAIGRRQDDTLASVLFYAGRKINQPNKQTNKKEFLYSYWVTSIVLIHPSCTSGLQY